MAVNIGPKIGVDGEAEYRKQLQNIIQQAKTLSSEMKAVTASFDENTSAAKKAKESARVLAEQVKVQKEKVAALSDMLKKSSENLGDNDTKTLKWKQALNDANAELAEMSKELKDAKKQSNLFLTAIDNLGEKAKDVAKAGLSKLGDAAKSGLKGALNIGAGAVKGLGTAVAAMGTAAATGIAALGKIGLDYNSEMEQYTTNFEVMLGSQEAAVAKVESLKKLAASTPFEMSGLADATQQLLAMNVASEDTEKYITQLGDISLGNSEKFNSLVNAFGKMNSTGKVTLEYVNMMAEQGFNPLNVIAQQTGETMEQLYDRLSDGNVTLDEVKNAMEIATSTGGQFADGMKKASETTEGLMSTLADNAKSLVGKVFEPISKGLKNKVLPGAIEAVDKLAEEFRENGIGGMVEAAGEIIADTLGQFTNSLPQFVNVAVSVVQSFVSGIRNNQKQITSGAITTIKTLVSGLTSMLPDLLVTGAMLLGELAVGILNEIPNLIASIPQIIQSIVDAFRANSGVLETVGKNLVVSIQNGIAAVWSSLVSWFNGIWNSLFGSRKVSVGVSASATTSRSVDGSHASGLGYVPFDGYIARLHKGEMVLTKAQSDILRNAGYMYLPTGSTSGGKTAPVEKTEHHYGGVNIQIYQQPGESGEELAERIMEIMQTQVIRKGAAIGG